MAVDLPVKMRSPPFRKFALVRSSVDATYEPPVLTIPVLPTTTPSPLMTNTEPVALRAPFREEMPVPVTRLRVAPVPLSKVTLLPAPMEKLDQSMIAALELWSTVSDPPAGAPMVAEPAETLPPEGRVAAWAEAGKKRREREGEQGSR